MLFAGIKIALIGVLLPYKDLFNADSLLRNTDKRLPAGTHSVH